ncbi:MAG: phytanoyl-CoA dioxygenase family protein, partial [Alphaproteobacteria bacterium]|nr:phytanoyl-CoA dioxygenase family protein [Alphaproteobacteria bacterium]
WDIKAGDAVAFDFRTLHGASENVNKNSRRRVFSARIVGDDAVFIDRKGKGSPPFESLKLNNGDKLTGKEFPVIYKV